MTYTDHVSSVYTFHSTHKGQPMTIYIDFSNLTSPNFSNTQPAGWEEDAFHQELDGSVSKHLLHLTQICNDFWEQYESELSEDMVTQAGYLSRMIEAYDNYMNYC